MGRKKVNQMAVRFLKPHHMPYVYGGLGGLLFVFGCAALVLRANRQEAERLHTIASTPAQTADAVVEYKEYHNPYGKQRPWGKYPYELRFRVQGQIARLYSSNGVRWYETEIGASTVVTYHKSARGEIFVVDWQPKHKAPD